jgi:hypothetical protein
MMNRRHLLFTGVSLLALAGSGSLNLGKTYAAPTLAKLQYGPYNLVGHTVPQLKDVLLGHVRLDQVQAIYLPGGEIDLRLARLILTHGLATSNTERVQYRRMISYLFDDGTLKVGTAPSDTATREAQQQAWRAAVIANGYVPCELPKAKDATA